MQNLKKNDTLQRKKLETQTIKSTGETKNELHTSSIVPTLF